MNEYFYNLVTVLLMLASIAWIIYSLINSYGTQCFNMFDAYFTIGVFVLELIWSNFVNKIEE